VENLTRLLGAARGPKSKILVAFTLGQGVVLGTSVARIPLIVHSIGAAGYGLLLSVTALAPWMLLVIGGLTNVARVDIAEALGSAGEPAAWERLEQLRRRAFQVCAWVTGASILAALIVPWNSLLLTRGSVPLSGYEVPLGVAVSGVMVALSASGAVYQGLLHAARHVAVTSILPGAAAILSLVATAAAATFSAPFVVFVLATVAASCSPYWLVHILGLRHRRRMRHRMKAAPAPTRSRRGGAADLVVMTGAAAPPLFSTGWDPVVLGAAAGPQAVAVYGLASRLALLVTVVPSALYPHFWSEYARLRAAGDLGALRAHLRRDILVVVSLTTALGALYTGVGPFFGALLGAHQVEQPRSLYAAMAVLGVLASLQTVVLPLLGDRRSARITATLVFVFTVPNVFLSYLFSRSTGAVGPILASILFSVLLLGFAWLRIHQRPELLVAATSAAAPPPTADAERPPHTKSSTGGDR
jgi:O-antigen/teichoic acid export membrane protein